MNDLILDSSQSPFLIEHGQAEVSNVGYFTPVARLVMQPALRTSGLLAALPDREAKSLLLLLTYLTPNGRIEPTTAQIAGAFHLPECAVRSRMGKLTAFRWQGERIVRHAFRESGLDSYRISPGILTEREAPTVFPETGSLSDQGRTYTDREAVIAHSRAAYGRPRADVEENIARQLGITVGLDPTMSLGPEELEVRRQLIDLGVSPTQADQLLAEHPVSVIRDQLVWLPNRAAHSPARYVVRAINERYDPPPRVRLERAIAAAETEEAVLTETERYADPRTDEA